MRDAERRADEERLARELAEQSATAVRAAGNDNDDARHGGSDDDSSLGDTPAQISAVSYSLSIYLYRYLVRYDI